MYTVVTGLKKIPDWYLTFCFQDRCIAVLFAGSHMPSRHIMCERLVAPRKAFTALIVYGPKYLILLELLLILRLNVVVEARYGVHIASGYSDQRYVQHCFSTNCSSCVLAAQCLNNSPWIINLPITGLATLQEV